MLTPYSPIVGFKPLTQITPFTYRDGATFAEVLNRFESWLKEVGAELDTSLNQYTEDIQGIKDSWEESFAEFMSNVIQILEGLNDQAAANLVKNPQSLLRKEIDKLFATFKSNELTPALTQLQDDVDTAINALTTSTNTAISSLTTQVNQRTTNTEFGQWDKVNQQTLVSAQIMPRAHVEYKRHAVLGYQYEVLTVDTYGFRVPSLMSRRFSHDMQDSVGKGDAFIFPDGSREAFSTHTVKTGAGVVFNCSGMQTLKDINPPYAMLRGVQIHNGKIYRDFEPASNRGRHALGWRKDGTFKSYSIEWGDSAASMITDGVVESYGFGPTLVRNGAQQNIEALTYYGSLVQNTELSGRTILGSTKDNVVKLITVTGVSSEKWGVAGNNIADLAFSEGLHNAIMLDGGGSTQAAANGAIYHPSSDSGSDRVMGDVGLIRCSANTPSNAHFGGEPITLNDTLWVAESDVYAPRAYYRGGMISLMGNLSYKNGTIPVGEWIEVGSVPKMARPDMPLGTGYFTPVGTNSRESTVKMQIRAYGAITVTALTEGLTGFSFSSAYAAR